MFCHDIAEGIPAPLTKASESHCTPTERHHLQRLLLSFSSGGDGGSSSGGGRSSGVSGSGAASTCARLDFYSVGTTLGEGSFAKVSQSFTQSLVRADGVLALNYLSSPTQSHWLKCNHTTIGSSASKVMIGSGASGCCNQSTHGSCVSAPRVSSACE